MNGLMFGQNKSGFSLIEIMVAISIIAILATAIIPNLTKRSASQERKAFIDNLSSLAQLAWQQALTTGKMHRLSFDMAKHLIQLSVATDKKDSSGNTEFIQPKGYALKPSLNIPKSLEIKNFYIDGVDEMGRYTGRATEETWFFIMPSGYAQSVVINMVDNNDKFNDKGKQIGLVLNPFNAQFKEYDTFQKP